MFEEAELLTIESLKGNEGKTAAKELAEIWDKYKGTNEARNCFCNRNKRVRFIKDFYEWFEDNK